MIQFNAYGYDEGGMTITLPEEARMKWNKWRHETYDWRGHIQKHIDDKHDETRTNIRNHVTSETNRAITEIGEKITTASSYVITQVNNNTNNKISDVKSDISSVKTIVNNILGYVQNKP